MPKLKVEGLDKLEKALKDNVTMNDVKRVVRHHGSQLQRTMQTKRSIGLEIKDGGFTASVGPETEYSPYLEYGTRFMQAQPFIKPAHDEQKQKFRSDMQKLVR